MKKTIISLIILLSMVLTSCVTRETYNIKNIEFVGTEVVKENIMTTKMVITNDVTYSIYNITLENDSVVEYKVKGELNLNKNHKIEITNNDYSNPQMVYVL